MRTQIKINHKRVKGIIPILFLTLLLSSCTTADPEALDGRIDDKGGDLVVKNSMYKPPTGGLSTPTSEELTELLIKMDKMKLEGIWSVDGEEIVVASGRQNPGDILNSIDGIGVGETGGSEYEYKGKHYPRNDTVAQQLKQSLPPMGNVVPSGTRITSGWGIRKIHPTSKTRRAHEGLDFGVKRGTPIKAAWAGKVKSTSYSGGYGKLMVIDHGGGLETRYAHLDKFLVSAQAEVKKDQLIANSGSTGVGTGPHLHFEIRYKGQSRNPHYFFVGKDVTNLIPYNTEGWGGTR